ncbi:MAG: ribose transport system ATP-binding protein [Solirubrobacteraceae bacterium]|nr:ribose transport system ATP-binding protein [Solirubrobacteraceae bacterium]
MSAPESGPRPLVSVRGLVKRYPGVLALDRADVDLMAGQVLGLVGKNGAGKSTLIKILAGAVQPDEGTIAIDGQETAIHDPHSATKLRLAFVHQELADVPNLSVAENIELGLGFPKVGGTFVHRRALRRRARDVLDRLSVDIDPAARLSRLSVAQRRLVMIARGLAADARLLVLDEPSAALTDDEIDHLHGVVRGLRDDGVASVYVSHRLDEILEVTDSVVVMRDGRPVFASPTADITKQRLVSEIAGQPSDEIRVATAPAPPDDAPELLRVENLTRDGAVEDASFVLRRGEILGIAGMVGAGRSELVRMLFGADKASSGRVLLEGRDVDLGTPRHAMRAGVVLLPEDRRHEGLVLDFSVRKNVTLPALSRFRRGGPSSLLHMPSAGRERSEARLLGERLSIKVADPDHPARFLSGGNQQKVVLAKWLARGAEVFMFDEPTAGIDVQGKSDVYAVMAELAAEGKGVIFISSEFSELVGVCNRVLVMREGRIVGELEGDEITDGALVERCYAHAT